MSRPLFLSSFVAVALAAAACSSDTSPSRQADERPPPGELVRSEKPRLTSSVPAEDTAQLTRDDADFAFAVMKEEAGQENFFVSPHSMSIALAMTYAGARGSTAEQMSQALRFRLPPERLHRAMGALDLALASRAEKKVESGEAFELEIVNALFGQRGYAFLPAYLDLLAESYGAGMSLLDFAADPEAARSAINGWVGDRTRTRIPELIPQGVIDRATVLVLANAIYFKASWKEPFEEAQTVEGPFEKLDGTTVDARFMRQSKEHGYADGDGFSALELGYVGDDVTMLVLLPDSGTFASFVASLDADRLAAIVASLGPRAVDVTLPKFQMRTQLGMKPLLRTLGMTDAFEPGNADLSGMDGTRSLFVQDVLHESFVAVDEKGTEAAAATAVVVGRTSAPERATFEANRPFVVVIRDRPTGAVLFVGQVTET